MVFNDPTTGQGICQDIDFMIGTDSTSYPIEQKTRNINNAYDKVSSLIMRSDAKWEWDDNNFNTLPVGTTDLLDGQADYEISDADFLEILRVEIVQQNGDFLFGTPISYEDRFGVAMTEWAKTPGQPLYYDKVGNSLILYPTPNFSYEGGVRVYFKRNPSYFTVADTTKEPGFARTFHKLLSYYAAIDYCIANALEKKMKVLYGEAQKMEKNLQDFFSSRARDAKVRFQTARENYGPNYDYIDADPSVDWRSSQ